jgi:hypothetical protein
MDHIVCGFLWRPMKARKGRCGVHRQPSVPAGSPYGRLRRARCQYYAAQFRRPAAKRGDIVISKPLGSRLRECQRQPALRVIEATCINLRAFVIGQVLRVVARHARHRAVSGPSSRATRPTCVPPESTADTCRGGPEPRRVRHRGARRKSLNQDRRRRRSTSEMSRSL